MGGLGSGRQPWTQAPPMVSEHLRLDARRLAREGGLAPARTFTWYWPCGASVRVMLEGAGELADQVVLAYTMGDRGEVAERVSLERTASRVGTWRAWFKCPGCDKRAALLYLRRGRFRCRRCHGLTYRTQRETERDRLIRKARRIRVRLGGSGSLADPFPRRPKGMHRATYRRLARECLMAEAAWWAPVGKWIGSLRK